MLFVSIIFSVSKHFESIWNELLLHAILFVINETTDSMKLTRLNLAMHPLKKVFRNTQSSRIKYKAVAVAEDSAEQVS